MVSVDKIDSPLYIEYESTSCMDITYELDVSVVIETSTFYVSSGKLSSVIFIYGFDVSSGIVYSETDNSNCEDFSAMTLLLDAFSKMETSCIFNRYTFDTYYDWFSIVFPSFVFFVLVPSC